MDRSLAVLGATKSIENARKLLEDSEVLLDRRRFGTSYALAIFALEEIAKAFVFHWVADGNLDETDLRKLIYSHRSKHAAIALMAELQTFAEFLGPKFIAFLSSDSEDSLPDFEDLKRIELSWKKEASKYMHLLIHAEQRREASLYVDICDKCNKELLGPWVITRSDVDELVRFVKERLAKTDSLIRNCNKHELDESGLEIGIEVKTIANNLSVKQKSFRELVQEMIPNLDRAAKTECEHVLCSDMKRSQQRTLPQ